MKTLFASLAIAAITAACSVTSSSPSGGSSCSELAKRCPACTLPNLKQTCDAAVASKDEASCKDGLDDKDVRASCVPSTTPGTGTDSGPPPTGSDSGADTGVPPVGGQCPLGNCTQSCGSGQTCVQDCAGGNCTQTCGAGATCDFACSGGNCKQSCTAGSSCTISCSGASCTQLCASTCNKSCNGGNCD